MVTNRTWKQLEFVSLVFILFKKAQAKVTARSYDFRSEAVRGMHVTYPTPEPVVTPRAREGLRAVVPTIFPPSAVNRGESVRVRPPELPHEHHQPALRHTASEGLVHIPKKRGPKPKPRFQDGGHAASEPHRRRAEEQVSHAPHKLLKLQGGGDTRPLKVSHRYPDSHGHKPHHHHHHHHLHPHHHHTHKQADGGAYKYSDCSLRSLAADKDTHRTTDGFRYLAPAHFKHQPKRSLSCPAQPPLMEKPYFFDRPSPTRLDDDQEDNLGEVTWKPLLSNAEKVLVTDVTTNFLTVTIKESSTSQGFFKDKR